MIGQGMNPTEKSLRVALVASGWPHGDVKVDDSLLDLGLDSLTLALWVAELERQHQVKIPFDHLTIDQWETLNKAVSILDPILKGQTR